MEIFKSFLSLLDNTVSGVLYVPSVIIFMVLLIIIVFTLQFKNLRKKAKIDYLKILLQFIFPFLFLILGSVTSNNSILFILAYIIGMIDILYVVWLIYKLVKIRIITLSISVLQLYFAFFSYFIMAIKISNDGM
jgi:hypothetical protein